MHREERVTQFRLVATRRTMLKITAARIAAHNLPSTPEEYIRECQRRTNRKEQSK